MTFKHVSNNSVIISERQDDATTYLRLDVYNVCNSGITRNYVGKQTRARV